VVLPLDRVDPGPFDREDRDPPAVGPTDLDVHQLAAAGEPESAEEEVVRLKHAPPPPRRGSPLLSHRRRPPPGPLTSFEGEIRGWSRMPVEVRPVSPHSGRRLGYLIAPPDVGPFSSTTYR